MTDGGQSPGPGVLRQKREATIAKLCQHFALDHLEADDLEKLIDRAHRTTSAAELDALLEDLPTLGQSPVPIPAATVGSAGSQTILAILGGAERSGGWVTARRLHVFAVMGGAILDFRDTPMPAGTTEVEVYAVMGGVEVIVPPGIRVSTEGIGIMGGFSHTGDPASPPPGPDAPLLRLSGVAFLGGVEVTERLPGESAKEARRRQKTSRKLPPAP